VLYAATRPEAAFAEVFLRQLSLMLIRELDLHERSISEITCKTPALRRSHLLRIAQNFLR
jgi:hypothetical protein